jgi:WD40 repeat protein
MLCLPCTGLQAGSNQRLSNPQVFDAGSRTLLRQFKAHKAPVHVARFALGQLHVLSGGDDGQVMLWDVTSGEQVRLDAVAGWRGWPLRMLGFHVA